MEKKQKSKYSALRKAMILAVVVMIGFTAWSLIRIQRRNNNEDYFSKLAATTLNLYSQQAQALGLQPSDNDLKKHCYQAGQGPFDDGHLTCGVEVSKKIQIEAGNKSAKDIFSELADILDENGFVIVGGSTEVGTFSAGIYNNPDAPCRSYLNYRSAGENNEETIETLEYYLQCSKRASHIPTDFSYAPLRP